MAELNIHKEAILGCACHMRDHALMVEIEHFPRPGELDWRDIDFMISLIPCQYAPWYKRVWFAVKYIFGGRPHSYFYHDTILPQHQVAVLHNLIHYYEGVIEDVINAADNPNDSTTE